MASVFYEKSSNFASKMICIYDKKQNSMSSYDIHNFSPFVISLVMRQ